MIAEQGAYYIGGKLNGLKTPKFPYPTQTPAEVRAQLPAGKSVVAFQNRNPIHRLLPALAGRVLAIRAQQV